MWHETTTDNGIHLIDNQGGKQIAYWPGSGVLIIEQDGFAFKDLARAGKLLPYEDWRLSAQERADDLAKRLSVEQIAGLMCYSLHQVDVKPELDESQKDFLDGYVRSVLNSCGLGTVNNEEQILWANAMQKYAEGMPMGIPCYIASDPRNGQGVSDWPGNLSLAATFDPALAKESAKCQSLELRDLGSACFLAPQADIASDPRWYRFNGTFGEDPALSRDMTRAFCDGLQSTYDENGRDLGWGKDSVTAMVKHWTGEGAGEGGREAHLEGGKYSVYPGGNFEALMIPFVDGAFRLEGSTGTAAAVMSSYSIAYSEDGSLGEKVGSGFSDYKIRHLLRERYGFEGPVCTDWMVLNEGRAEGQRCCGWGVGIEEEEITPAQRAFRAIMAGVDQMGGCSNPAVLVEAYHYGCGQIGRAAMDKAFAQSARRLLQGYFLTGMFENPYLDPEACLADVNSPARQEAAMDAQVRAIVMLKNEKNVIAPMTRRKKVYLPALFEAEHQQYSHRYGMQTFPAAAGFPIKPESCSEYFDVLTDRIEGTRVIRPSDEELASCDLFLITGKDPDNVYPQDTRLADGFHPISRQYRPYTADGPHVRKVSLSGDILPDGTKENRSYFGRTSMPTNPEQLGQILELGEKARQLNVPSVLCMFTGKPLCFHEFEPAVDAILLTFSIPTLYGGSDSSSIALARIVAGISEPSGLLPMQMPADMDDIEAQLEDCSREMACYVDAAGHKYDFAYGMNYAGVINDDRVKKYRVPVLTAPENKGKI